MASAVRLFYVFENCEGVVSNLDIAFYVILQLKINNNYLLCQIVKIFTKASIISEYRECNISGKINQLFKFLAIAFIFSSYLSF